MRAVVIREPGDASVLAVANVPDPEVPASHVRVRVAYAGVNRADLMQRAGFYPAPPGAPKDIPGLEYVGVVESLGAGASRFAVGDRVYGLVGGGAYAELVVAHEREMAHVPPGLSDEAAGAVPEAFITAYDALVTRGRLEPGERVLIHAVGSGVGIAGLQIAKALGSFTVGTSRTQDKLDRCKDLGLDAGVVPTGGAFAGAVNKATKGAGVDVVLDLVGGSYFAETLRACASRARVVVVGLTAGASSDLDLRILLQRRLEIIGTMLRSRPLEEKIVAARALGRNLGPWLGSGLVRPVVDAVFPLEDAVAAHRRVESNTTFGKVLLKA